MTKRFLWISLLVLVALLLIPFVFNGLHVLASAIDLPGGNIIWSGANFIWLG